MVMSNKKVERVTIQVIPHGSQRYPTAGDWLYNPNTKEVSVFVSDTGDWREYMTLALHELVEALLCINDNINQETVDAYDIAFEQNRTAGAGEPGDSFTAPYFHQHQAATRIEKDFAQCIGINFTEYDKHLDDLDIHWGE